jgi:hypothetical protein
VANFTFDAADLETVTAGVLFGPRKYRLDAMNVFRAANGESGTIEYLVNAFRHHQEAVDNSFSNVTAAATGASMTVDSVDMVILYEIALVSGRKFRLDLLNLYREAQGKDPVEYLVNTSKPTDGEFQTALSNLETVIGV